GYRGDGGRPGGGAGPLRPGRRPVDPALLAAVRLRDGAAAAPGGRRGADRRAGARRRAGVAGGAAPAAPARRVDAADRAGARGAPPAGGHHRCLRAGPGGSGRPAPAARPRAGVRGRRAGGSVEAGSIVLPDFASAASERLAEWTVYTPVTLLTVVLPPMLVGVWAARRRILEEPGRHRRMLAATAWWGLGIAVAGGLPD